MQAEQEFIQKNRTKNLAEIALVLSKQNHLDKAFILQQIQGWQKAKHKLPSWAAEEKLYYPPAISMEQCSSEATAKLKASLLRGMGTSIVDLTAGFGVDSFFFSQVFNEVHYVEPFPPLFKVVNHNFQLLNVSNIKMYQQTAEAFIKTQTQQVFSCCYIDPSRRNANQKVFLLKDCIPDITSLVSSIFQMASVIMVKTSPLLDLKQSVEELTNVCAIHVVAWKNECKELLFVLKKNFEGLPTIYAHNILDQQQQCFEFNWAVENSCNVQFCDPLNFIYEPNAAILKAGGFRSIAAAYTLNKIAVHSHLYTSNELIEHFPGRVFQLQEQLTYQAKHFKKLGIKKANISVRNFKHSVDQIRKKLKLKVGGDYYIFATTLNHEKPQLLLCKKVD